MNLSVVTSEPGKGNFELLVTLLVGFAWPLLVGVAIFLFRREIKAALNVLIQKASAADSMELGPFKMAGLFKDAAAKTAANLAEDPMPREVPEVQVETSEELEEELDALGYGTEEKLSFARSRLTKLSLDYELLRKNDPKSSPERTIKMNKIVALMRTFAVPALPALPSLARSAVAGERLAALAILQVRSSRKYIPWLKERFGSEEQPFLFFHAALVLRRMTQFKRFRELPELRQAIEHGLKVVNAFRQGTPDKNTIAVLEEALEILRGK